MDGQDLNKRKDHHFSRPEVSLALLKLVDWIDDRSRRLRLVARVEMNMKVVQVIDLTIGKSQPKGADTPVFEELNQFINHREPRAA